MALNFIKKHVFLRPIYAILLFCLSFTVFFTACTREVDYFDYVSELRNNIFLTETDDVHLRIYSVVKEYPYATDGIAHEKTARTEVYILPPDGTQVCTFFLTVDGNEYGGELSYDNVKGEYFLSFSLDTSALRKIACNVSYGEKQIQCTAVSVLEKNTLTPQDVLFNVQNHATELFDAMTDKYGFSGEIHLRLLYEDAPYYYVGVINRSEEITAFLVNATTGKVLAQRKP
jgi:hypothetical protein